MNRRRFLLVTGLVLALLGFKLDWGGLEVPQAMARGASKEESDKSRTLFEQYGKGGTARKVTPTNGIVTLAPGERASIAYRGYCLDQKFAAPSSGEPLSFSPMSNYIAPQLRELYRAVMRRAEQKNASNVDIQKIVWAMRSPAKLSWTDGLSASERAFLNAAMPGGAVLLQTAPRPIQYIGGHSGESVQGGGEAANVLGALLPQLMEQLPFNVRQHSDGLMRQLLNMKAKKPMPGAHASYSMLDEAGVAGKALGKGGLSVSAEVLNASSRPFELDVTQWVLESPRDVQAVALPQPGTITVHGKAAAFPDNPPNNPPGNKPDNKPDNRPGNPNEAPAQAPTQENARPKVGSGEYIGY